MEIYRFSLETLLYWTVAFSIYEWIGIYIIRSFSKNKFKTPVEYYRDLPSWVAVSGDYIYTTVIFLTAQIVFKWVDPFVAEYKLIAFLGVAVAVQWIYDLLFAQFVLAMPSGFSKYVSYFQRYIKEVTFGAAIADSIWVTSWILVTVLCMKYISIPFAFLILFISLFAWLAIKW